jgi:methyl-accepting chemotaxis protein
MTDLNADTRQPPANPPPAGTSSARRVRPDRAAARAAAARRWPLSRIIGVALLILLLFSVAAVAVGGWAVARLNGAGTTLEVVFSVVAAGLVLSVIMFALGLRAVAVRPLHRLAEQARRVADGDFGHEVTLTGPREVTDLAVDVNTMRERILDELAATRQANTVLQAHAEDLERSNSELEQFAYIASHDLQEPLRKVAPSGCRR